jgi:tripartite-type tricarboxylate transporter receptor subunit TctC
MRMRQVAGAAVAAAGCFAGFAQAATADEAAAFPQRPMRIIVGPGPDIVGRLVGQKMTEAWGQQVIVETRPGGGGAIAGEMVAKATPDGYTMLLASAAYTINAVLQPGSFDLVKDFSPVVFCASAPFVLLTHPSVNAKTVQELVALAKAKPGQLIYASSGNGTPPHLAGELFKSMAGVNILHVPYKNAAPALIDTVAGQVQMMFAITSIALPQVQSGKLRGLGVSSAQRTPLASAMPTIAESGLPGYEVIGWNGLLAPAGTPRAVVAKLNAEVSRGLKLPDLTQRLSGAFYDTAAANTPEQFATYIRQEISKWAKLVKETGAKVD